jgi:hypothetical protein
MILIEWSDEPVLRSDTLNQQQQLMASLWHGCSATCGSTFWFSFLFFRFFSFLIDASSLSMKFYGIFQMLSVPFPPTVQICPSMFGLKSMPKIEPSWVFVESVEGCVDGVKVDSFSYSSIPPVIA